MAVDGILGIKLGMTQFFTPEGLAVPCTVLQAGPCVVVQRRSKDKDGYDAVQLGLVEFIKPQRINKALTGHFKKANVAPVRFVREVDVIETPAKGKEKAEANAQAKEGQEASGETKAGDRVLIDGFAVGEFVDVSGVSKGKGFAGGVKRWHYRGGDATHGSMFHRAPGGIGASSFPSRVWRGQHFPGHMGNENHTAKNLRVVKVDTDENLMFVRGAVAGATGSYIVIRKSKRKK